MSKTIISDFLWRKPPEKMKGLDCLVTLSPGQDQFANFSCDPRLAGIRMNNFGLSVPELKRDYELLKTIPATVPLYADVKGRQVRVEEVIDYPGDHLELVLNHAIDVETPLPVLFKAGTDSALLLHVRDGGRRLIFQGGRPKYRVREGESLHLRHESFRVTDASIFTPLEREKIEIARQAGMNRFFLSYVESLRDIAELREIVGNDAEIWLKIETKRGLEFVARDYRKEETLVLVAATGDLFVEIDDPDDIADALKLIIEKDADACVGSRILLSLVENPALPTAGLDRIEDALKYIIEERPSGRETAGILLSILDSFHNPVPSCADMLHIAWLYEHGYRRMLICDNLYLQESWINTAITILKDYHARESAKYDLPIYSGL
ncbi:pyruvate kinase [bacterium]|nr:pyruvate kinase [bacterium]MCI0565953.1 pyruvate kinase [bacterium]MCI0679897.1 pyruvate kinase [bacterium]